MTLTKSVKLSEKTHKLLSEICPKTKTYDEIIYEMIIKCYPKCENRSQ